MLRLSATAYEQMIGHAFDCFPEEACGLMAGTYAGEDAPAFHPCRNVAGSAKLYTIDGKDMLRIGRAAEDQGHDLVGVMHSHTHTDAYPSPTDVALAVDPTWHYVIVSLKYDTPVLRSYRIADGEIAEEPVVIADELREPVGVPDR